MHRPPTSATYLLLLALLPLRPAAASEELWEAARKGDVKAVEALLDKGADVNARTRYGASALWFAASKGHADVVKLLLARKADVNVRDGVWRVTPLEFALNEGKLAVAGPLLEAGAGADVALLQAVSRGRAELVTLLLDKGKARSDTLGAALVLAGDRKPIREALEKAGAKPLPKLTAEQARAMEELVGDYEAPAGHPLVVAVKEGVPVVTGSTAGSLVMRPVSPTSFRAVGNDQIALEFTRKKDEPVRLSITVGPGTEPYGYVKRKADVAGPAGAGDEDTRPVTTPRNWPSFRGPGASGVADGQRPPVRWDLDKGTHVRWKRSIPGLAHASPIVWDDRVYVATAVSSDPKSEFKPGQYGTPDAAKDTSEHAWKLYCLDRGTGEVRWEKTAHKGVPKLKRHPKASQASSTPATDGRHVVVWFGSEGLYCYDSEGRLVWKRDLGIVDAGAFNDPELQWGSASSPVLYRDMVIVQCDRHKDSFVAAFDVKDGRPLWRTARDEVPSWGTPTVVESRAGAELVTNGTRAVRGYDALTGKERWHLTGCSEITVPTPFAGGGLIFVASGYHPVQPIFAIWPGSRGDLTPKKGTDASGGVAWSKKRGGPYMPTPIVYGEHLYVCSDRGILACLDARTGAEVYRRRLGGTYTASPVAADGRLYFASEEGDVRVVRAGPEFELLAVNAMKETCMATPAIASGMLFVRTRHHLYALGRDEKGKERR